MQTVRHSAILTERIPYGPAASLLTTHPKGVQLLPRRASHSHRFITTWLTAGKPRTQPKCPWMDERGQQNASQHKKRRNPCCLQPRDCPHVLASPEGHVVGEGRCVAVSSWPPSLSSERFRFLVSSGRDDSLTWSSDYYSLASVYRSLSIHSDFS